MLPQFGSDADSVRAMCEGWADILIYNGVLGRVAMAVTEALMLKMIAVNVQPMLPTREAFPMGGKMKLPKFLHLFFWWLLMSKLAFPAVLQRAIAEWKAANGCKLPPLDPWVGVYLPLQRAKHLWLLPRDVRAARGLGGA